MLRTKVQESPQTGALFVMSIADRRRRYLARTYNIVLEYNDLIIHSVIRINALEMGSELKAILGYQKQQRLQR